MGHVKLISHLLTQPSGTPVIRGQEKGRQDLLYPSFHNETRERAFYLKNAERTKNQVGKTMLRQIADEELEHYEGLNQLHERWSTILWMASSSITRRCREGRHITYMEDIHKREAQDAQER